MDYEKLKFTPTSLTISTIPEPSSALLTGFGLLALLWRRQQKLNR